MAASPESTKHLLQLGGDRQAQRFIEAGPFEVHIARTFPLDRAAEAHRALDDHYLDKLALRLS